MLTWTGEAEQELTWIKLSTKLASMESQKDSTTNLTSSIIGPESDAWVTTGESDEGGTVGDELPSKTSGSTLTFEARAEDLRLCLAKRRLFRPSLFET